jgi:hypothetical protein
MTMHETLFADADGTALLWGGHSLVQVRRGSITIAKVDALTARLKEAIASPMPHKAALLLLEEGAQVPDDAVRKHQQAALPPLLRSREVSTALVVLGDSLGAQLQRSLARMYLIGARGCRVFSNADDAITWLTTELNTHGVRCDAAGWRDALADARRWPR